MDGSGDVREGCDMGDTQSQQNRETYWRFEGKAIHDFYYRGVDLGGFNALLKERTKTNRSRLARGSIKAERTTPIFKCRLKKSTSPWWLAKFAQEGLVGH